MRRACFIGVLAATALSAGGALADDLPPIGRPDAEGRDVIEQPRRAPAEIAYQLETGVASTRVLNGIPQYSNKAIPSSESLAALTFRHAGIGELKLTTSLYAALADRATQPTTSLNVAPGIAYGGRIGAVDAAVGYTLQLLPRGTPVDSAHQIIVNLAAPNRVLTPTLDVTGEVAHHPNIYATAGVERDFTLGRFTLTPRASFGVTGGEAEVAHANDMTVSVKGQLGLTDNVYVLLRPAYSLVLAPAAMLKDPSFPGRSTPYVFLALGVKN